MKRRPRFLIVLGVAALTFGTLMATVGPERFNRHHRHHHGKDHCQKHESIKQEPKQL